MTGVSLAVILAAMLTFVGLTARSAGPSTVATAEPSTFTATGEVDVVDGDRLAQGHPCQAPAGYADIRQGAPVVLRDGDGRQVTATTLNAGRSDGSGRCVFTWEAAGVPTTGGPYVADIAGHGTVLVTAPARP